MGVQSQRLVVVGEINDIFREEVKSKLDLYRGGMKGNGILSNGVL